MNTYDLSILIPSRNEMFLARTIENILENIEGNTEIITVLDGAWTDPPIKDDPRVTIIHHSQSIGQRAATNEAARLSKAKYVMKCDAHCAFDKGFDIKMMEEMHDDWTMAPLMKNLHAFDWVCGDGHRRYQGPSGPCLECAKETKRDILWEAKDKPNSVSYCFDSTPHFQYFSEFSKRPEGMGDITETMSLQGSCWMLTRDKYWSLMVCDENFGSWGSQGIEVAVKTWLSGGKVMVNKKTWYAHMFRTQGGDFGFPYPISGTDQEKAKSFARDLFFNNKWDKQIHPLSWLVEKFWPVKGWTNEDLMKLKANKFKFRNSNLDAKPVESEPLGDELVDAQGETEALVLKLGLTDADSEIEADGDTYALSQEDELPSPQPWENGPTKGIIFYTDHQLKLEISHKVQNQLRKISEATHIPIVSVSLKPMSHFGNHNIHIPQKRSYLTMFKQILAGLEASTADVIFFCEHDVLYHPSHFDFTPPKKDVYYYNTNVWKVRFDDGHAVHYDVQQTSGLCAYRDLLIAHYRERIKRIEADWDNLPNHKMGKYSYSMRLEPGTRTRPEGIDDFKAESWESEFPNVDIRHGKNLTFHSDRWAQDEFKNKSRATGWTESDEIPGWGSLHDFWRKIPLTMSTI